MPIAFDSVLTKVKLIVLAKKIALTEKRLARLANISLTTEDIVNYGK